MENHPIPQDVTGFKFRLIGSITVKQFLYLLGAGGIALVFYLLPLPILVKIPFMILPAIMGLSLAFVPIDGRPMDKMLFNFIKTIPAENQYIYHKQGVDMPFFNFTPPIHAALVKAQTQTNETNKKALLFNQLSKAYFKPDQEEAQQVANISSLFQDGQSATSSINPQAVKAPATSQSAPASTPAVHPVEKVAESLAKPHAAAVPAASPPEPQPQTQAPNMIPTSQQANGIDTPNIIQGVVIDPRGKPLPNIIVEIMDKNQTPLRAFRTNASGTFQAATPLPNGEYKIHLEDTLKRQEFSDVPVKLSGGIVQPVTIKSVDQREKLRQELFGTA